MKMSTIYIKSATITVAICTVSIFAFFNFVTPNAHAATVHTHTATMLAQLHSLLERLIVLQRQLLTLQGQRETNLVTQNSLVEVTTSTSLAVEPDASTTSAAEVSVGKQGVVDGDPRLVNGKIWWYVEFSDSVAGWIQEERIVRIPSVTINFDSNDDGVKDASVRLVGDYIDMVFAFRHLEDGTEVKMFETEADAVEAGFILIERAATIGNTNTQ